MESHIYSSFGRVLGRLRFSMLGLYIWSDHGRFDEGDGDNVNNFHGKESWRYLCVMLVCS